jgi:murein DD-endopeptidase MepM/ murein hydrolase activator NlpD
MARGNRIRKNSKSNNYRKIIVTIIGLVLVGAGVAGYILFESESPELTVTKQITFIGERVEFPINAVDHKSGLSSVTLEIEQNDTRKQLFNRTFQRKAWFSQAGPAEFKENGVIDIGKTQFKDGKATLIITARDFSLTGMLKGNETVMKIPVEIDTKAPRVSILHSQRNIRQGGTGIVIYTVSESSPVHGVEIDDFFFPGFPIDEEDNRFIAYIALPWDSERPQVSKVIARDQAGNSGKKTFRMNFREVRNQPDSIFVTDSFLKQKLPEFEAIYPELSGTPLEKYLFINREIRQRNADRVMEVCQNPTPKRLWEGRFIRMAGANKAGFADQRTYYYNGEVIDHQVHLGVDLASTKNAPVGAANTGKVIFAEYLGIYGYTVIIDHGQGVFSLYSHLSRIDTEIDSMVNKNDLIGHTGISGMTGGDHLHFSMLIHGVFVTHLEWWDQHWLNANIKAFIDR